MRAQVLIEEKILDHFAESAVVCYALIKLEIGIDELLDDILDRLVEGEPHIFARVDSDCGIQRRIGIELIHHLAERYAMLRP